MAPKYYMKINGVNIINYIESYTSSENDLDAPNSGRTLDGVMHRGKVSSKIKIEIKLVPVEASVLNRIFPLLRNEYISCETNLIPGYGNLSMSMYNSTRKTGIAIITTDGKVMHRDASFNIIQR